MLALTSSIPAAERPPQAPRGPSPLWPAHNLLSHLRKMPLTTGAAHPTLLPIVLLPQCFLMYARVLLERELHKQKPRSVDNPGARVQPG